MTKKSSILYNLKKDKYTKGISRKAKKSIVPPELVNKLIRDTTVRKPHRKINEAYDKKTLAHWEAKFKRSRGRISGSQKAAISKLPLNMQKKVRSIAMKYAKLDHKSGSSEASAAYSSAYSREILRAKSTISRAKRDAERKKKAFERELDRKEKKVASALGSLVGRIRARKLKEEKEMRKLREIVPLGEVNLGTAISAYRGSEEERAMNPSDSRRKRQSNKFIEYIGKKGGPRAVAAAKHGVEVDRTRAISTHNDSLKFRQDDLERAKHNFSSMRLKTPKGGTYTSDQRKDLKNYIKQTHAMVMQGAKKRRPLPESN